MRAFKRRISVSKHTRFCRGKRRDRKRILNEVYYDGCCTRVRAEEKSKNTRTDDGGAVVAHHAHD